MKLIAITGSSNVVAAGYEDGLLRIVFTDGAIYDAEGIPAEINAAFLAAPSKGQFINEWLKDKLHRGVATLADQEIRLREPRPSPVPGNATPLNSHEADPCCGRLIGDALRSGTLENAAVWTCPKCGMEWGRALDGSPINHWVPRPAIAVVPVRG